MKPDAPFNLALTVGATGMLEGAMSHIAKRAKETWVLARSAETLERPQKPNIHMLCADYSDADAFTAKLASAVNLDRVDLALLWMHDIGNKACLKLLDTLSRQSILIVHVAGSAAGDPEKQAARVQQKIDFGPEVRYCPVILGAMKSGDARRWLTHEEICAAAVAAIDTGTPQMAGLPLSEFKD